MKAPYAVPLVAAGLAVAVSQRIKGFVLRIRRPGWVLLVLASLSLASCAGGASKQPAGGLTPAGPATLVMRVPTRDYTLFDFDHGTVITSIDTLGRIPLGLFNRVAIWSADVRTGPNTPLNSEVAAVLSMRMGAPFDEFISPVPPDGSMTYQWDIRSAADGQKASNVLRVRVTPQGGIWVVLVSADNASPVQLDNAPAFGDFELVVRLPWSVIPPGISADLADISQQMEWQAATVYEDCNCSIKRLGDRFPYDGSWLQLARY